MAKSRIDQLKSLIAMDPEDHTLHYMIGLEYLESAQYDEAVAAFERYLETEEARDGDIGSCLGRLAEAYERMGRSEDAIQAYRRGIMNAVHHKHADLRNELTVSLQALQREGDGKE